MLWANEISRFGPTVPFVPARASVWQAPHLATNCCLPTIRLAFSPCLVEQPAPPRARASSTPPVSILRPAFPPTSRGCVRVRETAREIVVVRWTRSRCIGAGTLSKGSTSRYLPNQNARPSGARQRVQLALRRGDHAPRNALPGPALAHGGDEPGASPIAQTPIDLQPGDDALGEGAYRRVVH